MSYAIRDAFLKVTKALPNGAAATTSDFIDTGKGTSYGRQLAEVEFLITAPALGATPLPDAKTMKFDVLTSANSDGSSPTTLMPTVITQTGAGGVGASAATYRFKVPSDAARYVGVKATGSASGDASGSSFTVEALV